MLQPSLIRRSAFLLFHEKGQSITKEIATVLVPISPERASVVFVDYAAKKVYGQRYFSGADRDTEINRFAQDVAAALEAAYRKEAYHARSRGNQLQPAESTLRRMQDIIILKVQEARDS